MQCPRCGQPLTGDPPECSWCAGAPAGADPDGHWPPQPDPVFASPPNFAAPGGSAISLLPRVDDARECARLATIFALLIFVAPPVFGALALFYGFRAGLLGASRQVILPLSILLISMIVLICLFMKVR
jgi:hypothetical protein